jgi:hypothetical protein
MGLSQEEKEPCQAACRLSGNTRYKDTEVKKGEFQIIGRVVKKEKRYCAKKAMLWFFNTGSVP